MVEHQGVELASLGHQVGQVALQGSLENQVGRPLDPLAVEGWLQEMLLVGMLPQGFLVGKEFPVVQDRELLVSCLGGASLALWGTDQPQDLVCWTLVD